MDWESQALTPYRLRTVHVALQVTVATLVMLLVFRLLPGNGEMRERPFELLIVIAGAGTAMLALMPWDRILKHRLGLWVMYGWSFADIALISVGIALTGGADSQLFLLYALTSVFFSASYPPKAQAGLMVGTICCYCSVVLLDGGGVSPAIMFVRIAEIVLITYITLFLSKELLRQTVKSAELAEGLRAREARFRSLVQNASDVICVVDPAGGLSYVSPGIQAMLGYPPEYAVQRNVFNSVHADDLERVRRRFAEAISAPQESVTVEMRLRHRDGSYRWVEAVLNNLLEEPAVSGIVVNFRDTTERKAFEKQLQYQAFHDALTGLPNRAYLLQKLATASSDEANTPIAVLLLDLDEFKKVNDSLGHEVGDELLTAVVDVVRALLRPGEVLARLGGDEFTILLESPDAPERAEELAGQLVAQLAAGVPIGNRPTAQSASIGIAHTGQGGRVAADLLRRADLAMYAAKERGKSQYVVFDAMMSERARKRVELEQELRQAVRNGELFLEYQPLYELGTTNRLVGAEALVRWNHPQRGRVSPAEFIPLAEETGLILPIGKWVLEESCLQAREWRDMMQSPGGFYVSVNVSVRQFIQPGFARDIRDLLSRSGLEPQALQVEITESILMDNGHDSRATLQELRNAGIRIAIDDFGTGYSSLSYLREYPVDVLKVDRSFIESIEGEGDARALVHAITGLARTLNMVTVAEGVETGGQVEVLKELQCDVGQGYYLGRPTTPATITSLITLPVRRAA